MKNFDRRTITSRALICASDCFLKEKFPDDWENFSSQQLTRFIKKNRQPGYQETHPLEVLKAIQDLSVVLIKFYLAMQIEFTDSFVEEFTTGPTIKFKFEHEKEGEK